MRTLLALITAALLAAACGYKGPLYLPKDKPEAKKPGASPAPKKEEPKKEEEKQ